MASSSKFVGWAMKGKKCDHVNFAEETCSAELEKQAMDYLALLVKGPVTTISNQFRKDELLDVEKVLCDKPMARNINGHDLAWNIVLRMLFGDYCDLKTKHYTQSSSVVGVNPGSVGWKEIKARASKFENIIAGDESKQEASTTVVFAKAYAAHVASCYQFDNDNQAVMQYNACMSLNGYLFIVAGSIYETIRGHSSGHFLTADYNSFQVWSMHKAIFEEVCPEMEFSEFVSLLVLGDDSYGSVSDVVAKQFNMRTIACHALDMFGIKYTSPAKNGEDIEFIEPGSSSDIFLGRDFTHLETGQIVGRLRRVAIHDMLAYTASVPGMTPKEVNRLRSDVAFQEMSLYPEDEYNALADLFHKAWALKSKKKQRDKPQVERWSVLRGRVLDAYFCNPGAKLPGAAF
jgi:hypothetical protein